MSEDHFWNLVGLANSDPGEFERRLERMSRDELVGFIWMFDETAAELDDERYVGEHESEDYLEDLRDFVVGRGEEYYERVRDDPDQMPEEVDDSQPGIDIRYRAAAVFRDRFGEEAPPL